MNREQHDGKQRRDGQREILFHQCSAVELSAGLPKPGNVAVRSRLLGNMCRLLPVIVGDPDIVGVTRHPTEDHAPLIVDSNALAAPALTPSALLPQPYRPARY